MGTPELIGVAASLSLLAGWRLYATITALGLAMRFGLVALPDKIQALDVLTFGGLWLTITQPAVAGVLAVLMLVLVAAMIVFSWKVLKGLRAWLR